MAIGQRLRSARFSACLLMLICTLATPTHARPAAVTIRPISMVDSALNTPPNATTTGGLNVTQNGAPVTGQIATVADAQTIAGALLVAATGVPSGMTLAVTNTNGIVRASARCGCVAVGSYPITLVVTDSDGLSASTIFTITVIPAMGAQLIADPSFESGNANGAWQAGSATFGTPFCQISCNDANGTAAARTGTWWLWFGGSLTTETSFAQQTIAVPPSASLQFYLWINSHSGGGVNDYVRVLVNGNEIWRVSDAATAYDSGYTLVALDLAAYAEQSVVLRFAHSNGPNSQFINFLVDDVSVAGISAACSSVYALNLSAVTGAQTAPQGSLVEHTFILTNTGTTSDTFDLSIVAAEWPATLGTSSIGPLAAGASASFTVSVAIPSDADLRLPTTTTVAARSRGNPTVQTSASVTTTATQAERRIYLPLVIRK